MKILHTIQDFGEKSGGTSTCTYNLLSSLNRENLDIDILTLQSEQGNRIMGNGEEWIKVLENDSITPYGYSSNLYNFLEKSNYDIYHTNGLWMYCNHITCAVARKKNKPCIITPHGMLYPNALRRSYWKKYPLLKLFFNKDISKASCIHVTCEEEMNHVRDFGYKGDIAVIPNLIDIPVFVNDISRAYNGRRFGFLGRLHPIKKVENIIEGFYKLKSDLRDKSELMILGTGDTDYEKLLKHKVESLRLSNVRFLGFVSGIQKYDVLSSMSTLFVPSDFENFGMIVPEALSVGTPVMASLGTPWKKLNDHGCGWWSECTPERIAEVMEEVVLMNNDDLKAMGERGRLLVSDNFSPKVVSHKMGKLYNYMIHGGDIPDFLYKY